MSVPVVLVEDHELVADALALALRDEGVAVTRFAGPGPALDRVIAEEGPGVVLLDLELGGESGEPTEDGVALVHGMCRAGWSVLVVTATLDGDRLAEAVAEGAAGWVSKGRPLEELLAVYRRLARGEPLLDPARRRALLSERRDSLRARDIDRRRLERLTPREAEILAALAAGDRVRTIADDAHVSVATVRSQVKAIRTKLMVSSQLEAVALHRRVHGGAPAPAPRRGRGRYFTRGGDEPAGDLQ